MKPSLCILPFLLACAEETVCPPGFTADDDGVCKFDEDAVTDLLTHFDDGSLVQVNADPYMPVWSATPIRRNVWITRLAVEDSPMNTVGLYRMINQDDWSNALPAKFPVGTVIVHEAVDREEPHGVEVRRDDYEDDAGRGWWMRMIDDDGVIEDPSARSACSECHNEEQRPSEGLWGIPVTAR
jgi:hypothetical protein